VARLAAVTAAVAATAGGSARAATDSSAQATDYHLSVGPGYYQYPRYPGGRGSRDLLFPFIDAEYAGRFYMTANDLFGVYGYKTEASQLGAALEYDPTRRNANAGEPLLRELPNVKDTLRLKLFGSHTIGIVTGDMNIARDIEGHGQGTLGQANLWLTAPFDPTFSVSVGPGVTWADSRYMHTFFAVPTIAAMPRAGIADVHWNGLAEWQLLSKYRLGATATVANLNGDAASSPIAVRRRQTTVTGWIAYRFN